MITRPLAPALGHLADPPSPAPFDDLRLTLLDELVTGDGEPSIDAAWSAAWNRAVVAIRDRVVRAALEELGAAGRRSRYPERQLAGLLPDDDGAERLLHRLLAEGIALERLVGTPVDAEGVRRRGAALELAWEGAVRVAALERARWRGVASRVAGWRRPWRPLVVAGIAVSALAGLVALVLGGYLPTPGWFAPVVEWFWEVPWP